MTYNMLTFILYFLPISIILYYITPNNLKKIVLCILSIIFYGLSDINNVLLVIFLVFINYYFDFLYSKYRKKYKNDKFFFTFVLFYNLFLLVFFKINKMPIGFSFIIFNVISFHIDSYNKINISKKNFFDFTIYILFFGKVLQGPLVRYREFVKNIRLQRFNIDNLVNGLEYLIKGLFLKEVISNNIVDCINFINAGTYSYCSLVLHEMLFLINLYIDFYSYSLMAMGIANIFNISLPENFNYPLCATSMTDFWRKWHMSLSFWFRDYIYIPLGGSKVGIFRNIINLLAVWLITGLWHGISMNFVLWGLANFVILFIEKYIFRNKLDKVYVINHIWTICISFLVFILFQYTNLNDFVETYSYLFFIKKIDIINTYFYGILDNFKFWIIFSIIICTPLINIVYNLIKERSYIIFVILNLILLIVSFTYIISNNYSPFLYAKF